MHIPSATLIFSFSSDAQVVHTKSWNGEIIFIMADFFFVTLSLWFFLTAYAEVRDPSLTNNKTEKRHFSESYIVSLLIKSLQNWTKKPKTTWTFLKLNIHCTAEDAILYLLVWMRVVIPKHQVGCCAVDQHVCWFEWEGETLHALAEVKGVP